MKEQGTFSYKSSPYWSSSVEATWLNGKAQQPTLRKHFHCILQATSGDYDHTLYSLEKMKPVQSSRGQKYQHSKQLWLLSHPQLNLVTLATKNDHVKTIVFDNFTLKQGIQRTQSGQQHIKTEQDVYSMTLEENQRCCFCSFQFCSSRF